MKIHYVFQAFPEITQTFVFDQMRYLRNKGYHISISCKKLFKENMEMINCDFFDEVYSISDGTFWDGSVRNLFLKIIEGKQKAFIKSLADQLIGSSKVPDIIIAHFGPNVLLGAELKEELLNRQLKNIPVVGVFHGYDLSKYIQKHGHGRYQAYERLIDTFVTISSHWKNVLVEAGIPEQKVKVIRLGVEPELYNNKDKGTVTRKTIVSVGRMVEKKGFDDLLAAFRILYQENNNLSLEVVGDGPKSNELRQFVSENGLSQSVSFLGSLSHENVLERICNADTFVLASKTAESGDKEGIPVVLMEAMASGVPVISTYHSGIPELIENNISGLLVPENSPEKLASAIKKVLSDERNRQKMVLTARRVIETSYNQKVQSKAFENELITLTNPGSNNMSAQAALP